MTGSTHEYTAVIIGTPDVPIDLTGGTVTLDVATSPHVQGTLQLGKVDATLLAMLDPRQSPPPRVRIDVNATFPTDTQTRSFDLTVRGWRRDQETGQPLLSLSSDEALLEDAKPLYDPLSAFLYQDSLRDLVNYAMDLVAPGTALEATPAIDADVSVYSDRTNLVMNPTAGTNLTGWAFVGAGTFARQTGETWVTNTAGTAFEIIGPASGTGGYIEYVWSGGDERPFAGRTFRFSALVRPVTGMPAPIANSAVMYVYWRTVGGPFKSRNDGGFTTPGTSRQRRLTITFPDDVDYVVLRLHHGYASPLNVRWADVRAIESSVDNQDWEYFDGASVDTAGYEYEWEGTAHASFSIRTALIDREPESLVWKAGISAMEYLRPIVQAAGMRLVCDEQRKFTLRDATYTAAGTPSIAYAVNLLSGLETVDRDDDIWCDACVVRYIWDTEDGRTLERVDRYPTSGTPSRVRYIERDSPWPGAGFAQHIVERAQAQGRMATTTTVADWAVTTEQLATFTLHEAPSLTGKLERVEFDLNTDEMTVNARTEES